MRNLRPMFAVMAIVALIIGATTSLTIYQDYTDNVQRESAIVRDLSRIAASHMLSTANEADRALKQVIDELQDRGGTRAATTAEMSRRLRDFAANVDGCQSLSVIDASGKVLASSVSYPLKFNLNVADRPYFTYAKFNNRTYVSSAFESKVRKKLIYTISRPFHDAQGHFQGITVAMMDTSQLTSFYSLMSFDTQYVVGIYRIDGEIVARNPDLDRYVGNSIASGLLLSEVAKRPAGIYSSKSTLDGIERLAGYQLVPEYSVVAFAAQDWNLVHASWRHRTFLKCVEMGVVLLLLFIAIAWGFSAQARAKRARVALAQALDARANIVFELQQAQLDSLTQLPARSLTLQLASQMRTQSLDDGQHAALLTVDLDGFKQINDNFGHERGDQFLHAAGCVIRAALRNNDLVGRIGGDEFLVCVVGSRAGIRQLALTIANRVVDGIAELGNGLGASVGIYICTGEESDLSEAMRIADHAMYEAKHAGKGQHAFGSIGDDTPIHSPSTISPADRVTQGTVLETQSSASSRD